MANQPLQVPQLDLPKFEYFSTPGGTQPISVERRAAIRGTSATTAIAAGTSNGFGVSVSIDPQFGYSKAIVFHRIFLNLAPIDTSGQLQVTSTQLELQIAGTPILDIGFPLATLNSPSLQITVASEEEFLLTFQDAQQFAPTAPGALTLTGNVWLKNNDATNPHSAIVFLNVIWRILNGVMQQ